MKAPKSEEQSIVFIVYDDESLRDALVRLFRMVGLRAEGFATAADFLKRKWRVSGSRKALQEIDWSGIYSGGSDCGGRVHQNTFV